MKSVLGRGQAPGGLGFTPLGFVLEFASARVDFGPTVGQSFFQFALLDLPQFLFLGHHLALQGFVARDQFRLLGLVTGDQIGEPRRRGLFEARLFGDRLLFQAQALRFHLFRQPCLFLFKTGARFAFQFFGASRDHFVGFVPTAIESLFLLCQPPLGSMLLGGQTRVERDFLGGRALLQFQGLLLIFFAQRALGAQELVAVLLEQVLELALVAAAQLGLALLELRVERELLAIERQLLGADRLGLKTQAFLERGLCFVERLLLVRERGLQVAFGLQARGLDRVDELAAQRAEGRLAVGQAALERLDFAPQLQALLGDVRVLLARDLGAQFLAQALF